MTIPPEPDIALIAITPELARELQDAPRFERRHRVILGEQAALVAGVVEQTEAFRRTTGAPPRWSGSLVVDGASRQVVGTCSFKGAPDSSGAVEIAYFTFPAFERRGYAAAMARALLALAAASGEVRRVIAHTLPVANASTRVLGRLGFVRAGTAQDAEAGEVWRWERASVLASPPEAG